MDDIDLPDPGFGLAGLFLRDYAGKIIDAIGYATSCHHPSGHPDTEKLVAFFDTCADAVTIAGKSRLNA